MRVEVRNSALCGLFSQFNETNEIMLIPNRLCFYYEHILRQDLLLKLNCSNIMEIPRIHKIVMMSQVPTGYVQNMSLALESLCGQKCVQRIKTLRSERLSPINKVRANAAHLKKTRCASLSLRTTEGQKHDRASLCTGCLRKGMMYSFLDKLLILLSFYDCTIKFQLNSIQLTIDTNLLRLFPEIQNYFEWFENVQTLQVTLITSAKTEIETRLLWTGLLQKEV
jgi:ribosomal protein L5